MHVLLTSPPPITFDDCLWSLAVMLPHRDATPILIGRWGQMAIKVPVVQIDPDTWTSALGKVRYKAAVRCLLSCAAFRDAIFYCLLPLMRSGRSYDAA